MGEERWARLPAPPLLAWPSQTLAGLVSWHQAEEIPALLLLAPKLASGCSRLESRYSAVFLPCRGLSPGSTPPHTLPTPPPTHTHSSAENNPTRPCRVGAQGSSSRLGRKEPRRRSPLPGRRSAQATRNRQRHKLPSAHPAHHSRPLAPPQPSVATPGQGQLPKKASSAQEHSGKQPRAQRGPCREGRAMPRVL